MFIENLSAILLSCSTLYLHPNQTDEFGRDTDQVAQVIADVFPVLTEVRSPGCILVITNMAMLRPLTGLVLRSRSDIRVMVTSGGTEVVKSFKNSPPKIPLYVPTTRKQGTLSVMSFKVTLLFS